MISLLTYNIKMLPGTLGKDNNIRVRSIIKSILDINPDVVCFQEVFDEDIRNQLEQSLSNVYNNIIRKGDIKWNLLQDSGLFIASKFEITGWDYFPFLNGVSWDSLSNKGFIRASITTEFGNFCLINTHLQSDYNSIGEHSDIRKEQLKKISTVSTAYNFLNPVIIVGDFNICAEENQRTPTTEYLRMLKILKVKDLYREEWPNEDGFTIDLNNPMVSGEKESQRIDYVLSTDDKIKTMRSVILTMNEASDHYVLYNVFKLE